VVVGVVEVKIFKTQEVVVAQVAIELTQVLPQPLERLIQ